MTDKVDAFFEAMDRVTDDKRPARSLALATVDPAYGGTGNAKVTFDGETSLSTKAYPILGRVAAGGRVVMQRVGPIWIIEGQIGGSALDALDSTLLARGINYGALVTPFTYWNGVGHGNGSDEWRRVGTVRFVQNDTPPEYTGCTCEVTIRDGRASWGQSMPSRTIKQYINFVGSNTGTTSNARSASIAGEWVGYNYLRVIKRNDTPGFITFEIHVRNQGSFTACAFEFLFHSGNAGATVIWENPLSDVIVGQPDNSTGYGAAYFYDVWGVNNPQHDTRGDNLTGWIPIGSFIGWASGWTQYAGQVAIGNAWCARVRRKSGIVYMEGMVSGGPTGLVFTLPAGLRPGNGISMRDQVISGGQRQRMDVQSTGQVSFEEGGSTTDWHNIGCSFVAEN